MTKKKKYIPKKDDDWDLEEARKHRKIINEKIKSISDTYKKWWDKDKKTWKKGYKKDG